MDAQFLSNFLGAEHETAKADRMALYLKQQSGNLSMTGVHHIITKNFGHLYNDINTEADNRIIQLMNKFAEADEMNEE